MKFEPIREPSQRIRYLSEILKTGTKIDSAYLLTQALKLRDFGALKVDVVPQGLIGFETFKFSRVQQTLLYFLGSNPIKPCAPNFNHPCTYSKPGQFPSELNGFFYPIGMRL